MRAPSRRRRGRNECTYGASSHSGWCPHCCLMWDWSQVWLVKPKPHLAFNLDGDWWTWRRYCSVFSSCLGCPPPPFTEPALFGKPSLILASQDAFNFLRVQVHFALRPLSDVVSFEKSFPSSWVKDGAYCSWRMHVCDSATENNTSMFCQKKLAWQIDRKLTDVVGHHQQLGENSMRCDIWFLFTVNQDSTISKKPNLKRFSLKALKSDL